MLAQILALQCKLQLDCVRLLSAGKVKAPKGSLLLLEILYKKERCHVIMSKQTACPA